MWKRLRTWLVSIGVVLLAYAALDDITTGSEPDHTLEWWMVGLAVAWFLGLTILWISRRAGRSGTQS